MWWSGRMTLLHNGLRRSGGRSCRPSPWSVHERIRVLRTYYAKIGNNYAPDLDSGFRPGRSNQLLSTSGGPDFDGEGVQRHDSADFERRIVLHVGL